MRWRDKVPRSIKIIIKRIVYFGTHRYCNVCHSHIRYFLPGGRVVNVLKELQVVGAGYKNEDVCPVCMASYRERLVQLYLNDIDINNLKILHIAPEKGLYYNIWRAKPKEYYLGDANPRRYSFIRNIQKLDIETLPFKENRFDLVICNHVLEHVENDLQAMKEIFKTLKVGGRAILQVPISYVLEKTLEDFCVKDRETRLQKFGQEDHVRIYGKDYFERLKITGFDVSFYNYSKTHVQHLEKLALEPNEKLFVLTKKCQ